MNREFRNKRTRELIPERERDGLLFGLIALAPRDFPRKRTQSVRAELRLVPRKNDDYSVFFLALQFLCVRVHVVLIW